MNTDLVPEVARGTMPYWLHSFDIQVRQINDARNRWFDIESAGTITGIWYGLRKSTNTVFMVPLLLRGVPSAMTGRNP